jgi:sulfoxide reductase heme-binding subunit YedZ
MNASLFAAAGQLAAGLPEFNTHLWWYVARASGIVAWVVSAAACALGTMLATRLLKPYDRPAWLLGLHRYMSALFIAATVVHMLALVGDSYVTFTWKELLIPMASTWQPGAVAVGVVALYLAVLVEVSSLLMKKIPKRIWHALHMLSYASFVLISIHAVLAGTDARNLAFVITGAATVALFCAITAVKVLQTVREPQKRQVLPREAPGRDSSPRNASNQIPQNDDDKPASKPTEPKTPEPKTPESKTTESKTTAEEPADS